MKTYKITANPSGTRSIAVSGKHLETIEKYSLLKNLIDSNGIIDETALEKLRLNVRSMLESSTVGINKELLDLCLDIIYNNNMKAFGLYQLTVLFTKWKNEKLENKENND